jgi:hypothetical protein
LPLQLLSDLLWAGFGVNRANGDRTAPYWRHVMVLDIYLAMADGVWLYEPATHRLVPHLTGDIRQQPGVQDFVAAAPLELIYVAHGERMTDVSPEERRLTLRSTVLSSERTSTCSVHQKASEPSFAGRSIIPNLLTC